MKDLKHLLKYKKIGTQAPLDEKSVFYVFQSVIKNEYGRQGIENLKMATYKDNMIFIKAQGSFWANEIWLRKSEIVKIINAQLGINEIRDISMEN